MLSVERRSVSIGVSQNFAQGWVPGSSSSRSVRRRIIAILRLACRVLGINRDHLGLGLLGTGAAAAVIACGMIAEPVQAQELVISGTNVAGGPGASATGGDATALGSTATADEGTAVGSDATALGEKATAIGVAAKAEGKSASAFGGDAEANAEASTAIGGGAIAGQTNGVGVGATALGVLARADGEGAVAVGFQSDALADVAIAIGQDAAATAIGSVAVGFKPAASGVNSIAIGSNSNATGDEALAVGPDARAVYRNDMAFGADASARGEKPQAEVRDAAGVVVTPAILEGLAPATAFGQDANADGAGATAFGTLSEAIGRTATAFGYGAQAIGESAISVGPTSKATGDDSTALGFGAEAAAPSSVALGVSSKVEGENSVAIGIWSSASAFNSVALGAGSETTAALDDPAYNPGNAALAGVPSVTNGEVSVGAADKERRITNVASGAAPTDAVNVSQLQSQNEKVDQLGATTAAALGGGASMGADGSVSAPNYVIHSPGSTTASVAHTNVGDALQALDAGVTGNTAAIDKLGQEIATGGIGPIQQTGKPGQVALVAPDGTGAPQILTNVAPGNVGAGSTDAVNGGQLHDVAQTAGMGWTLSAQGANGSQVKPGETVDISGSDANIQVAKGAIDRNVTVALSRDLAIDSVTTGNAVMSSDGMTIAGGAKGPVTLGSNGLDSGGNTLTGVGAGKVAAGSTDAVNGNQLAETEVKVAMVQGAVETADAKAVAADVKAEDAKGTAQQALALGNNSIQYADATRASVTLGGATSSDGGKVGGTRLSNVAQGSLTPTSTDAINGSQLYNTNQQVAQTVSNVAANTHAINTLNQEQLAHAGRITSLTQEIDQGTIGLVRQEGGSPGEGRITIGSITGGTSIDLAGTSGKRVVTGVAAGVAADDAVNVSQLAAAISNASINAVHYDAGDHANVTFNAGGTSVGLHNVAAGRVAADSREAVNGAQLHAANQQAALQAAHLERIENGQAGALRANNASALPAPEARGSNSVAAGFGAKASGAQATVIGGNAVATGTNSVALGYGSFDDGRDNVVSIGNEGAERQLVHVAAGTRPTDAVNLAQLQTSMGRTLDAATAYTDLRARALSFDLANARSDADAGTASAMAIAGLPQAFSPGRGMIGGAIGVYQDKMAVALGASKVLNDQIVVKGGATYTETSRGSRFGANVGFGYQF